MALQTDAVPSRASRPNATRRMTFNQILLRISEELRDEHLDQLKFLLRDKNLPGAKLAAAKNGLDLFELLRNKKLISELKMTFLRDHLAAIRLRRIARELLNGGCVIDSNDPLRTVDPWRLLLLQCSEEVGDENLRKIKFRINGYEGLNSERIEKANSLLDLIIMLEESGKRKLEIRNFVYNSMNVLNKPLAEKVFYFNIDQEASNQSQTVQQRPRRNAHPQENPTCFVQQTQQQNMVVNMPVFVNSAPVSADQSIVPSYDLQSKPGICFIINIKKFYKDNSVSSTADNAREPPLEERNGSECDERRLWSTFKNLGFKVEVHQDLSDEGLDSFLNKCLERDYSDFSIFVCAVMTHGKEDVILCANGIPKPIIEITKNFSARQCQSLIGKPKIFLFQACQTADNEEYSPLPPTEVVHADGLDAVSQSTTDVDVFVGYATVRGRPAFRTVNGSWYIEALCNCIDEFADRYHFADIHLRVVNEVSARMTGRLNGRLVRQTPKCETTLSKHLYFKVRERRS